METKVQAIFKQTLKQQPELRPCRGQIEEAFAVLRECYRHSGKLLICGNGGSAADSEHIVGELMKGFLKPRPLPETEIGRLRKLYGSDGEKIARRLQGALPAISLVSQISLCTAITNDVSADMVFAQQVFGYGRPGDVLMGISTSGNAANVINAVKVARALDLRTIALSGESGTLKELAEITIGVPGGETARIQELHIVVYHALSAALEAELFGE
jgi:phosphoheptose isomerase